MSSQAQGDFAAIERDGDVEDGEVIRQRFAGLGARSLQVYAESDEEYDLEIEFYEAYDRDADDFSNLLATIDIATGVTGGTVTTSSETMFSPYVKIKLTDTSSDGGDSATATIFAHVTPG